MTELRYTMRAEGVLRDAHVLALGDPILPGNRASGSGHIGTEHLAAALLALDDGPQEALFGGRMRPLRRWRAKRLLRGAWNRFCAR